MATYDLTQTTPSSIVAGDILNCPYNGTYKQITLPPGTYKLECWGAEGGYRSNALYAGNGGYSIGTLSLTNISKTLYLYAGGSGNSATVSNSIYPGGFNGGGYRYGYYGGGGASDIRIGSTSLYARVIVAGGGGSDGAADKSGSYGGGTIGGTTTSSYSGDTYCGYGGKETYSGYSEDYTATTQVTTGLNSSSTAWYGGFGFGGSGIYFYDGYGGAGGGGWYGGSGTIPNYSSDNDRGGGGGSGYVYTSSQAFCYPDGCLLNSSYYLTDASTIAGSSQFTSPTGTSEYGHTGNGYVRITCLTITNNPPTAPTSFSLISPTKNYYTTITWTGMTNVESTDVITYQIWVRYDGGTWTMLGDSLTTNSYRYLVPSNYSTVQYAVRVYDGYSYSPYAYTLTHTINTASDAATIKSPLSSGKIYNSRPPIIVNVPNDVDGDTVQIEATIKNSDDIQLCQITSPYVPSGTGTVSLIPTVDLPAGTITVLLKTLDSKAYKSSVPYTFTIASPPSLTVSPMDPNISKTNMDLLQTMISEIWDARGISGEPINIGTIIANSTPISKLILDTTRSNVSTLLGEIGITPTWTDPIIIENLTLRKGQHWIEIYNYLKQI